MHTPGLQPAAKRDVETEIIWNPELEGLWKASSGGGCDCMVCLETRAALAEIRQLRNEVTRLAALAAKRRS